jgi:hypothetical protein
MAGEVLSVRCCPTAVGSQLIDLLVELSDDGNVSRDEMNRQNSSR